MKSNCANCTFGCVTSTISNPPPRRRGASPQGGRLAGPAEPDPRRPGLCGGTCLRCVALLLWRRCSLVFCCGKGSLNWSNLANAAFRRCLPESLLGLASGSSAFKGAIAFMSLIRVVSYNIHKGRSALGRRDSLNELRLGLYGLRPDLVFLQEVQGRNEQKSLLDAQHESLAAALRLDVAYGRNAIRHATDHGNALLSRFPILDHENLDISDHRLEQRGLLHERSSERDAEAEPEQQKVAVTERGEHLRHVTGAMR